MGPNVDSPSDSVAVLYLSKKISMRFANGPINSVVSALSASKFTPGPVSVSPIPPKARLPSALGTGRKRPQ